MVESIRGDNARSLLVDLSPTPVCVGHMGDKDISQFICDPRRFTDAARSSMMERQFHGVGSAGRANNC